jgi:hypothetical protein
MAGKVKQEGSLKDPGVVRGERFRPLRRTTGDFIVYDPELPPAQRTAGGQTFSTFAEADAYAMALAEEAAAKKP